MIPETAKDLRQLSFVSVDDDLLGSPGPGLAYGAPGPRAPRPLGAGVSVTSWPPNQEPAHSL